MNKENTVTKLVIINGLGGSGKSTFCKYAINYCANSKDTIASELSTIDYIKRVARMCGWQGTKEEKDRVFLHDLKVAFEKWNDSPNATTIEDIIKLELKNPHYNRLFFVNIREIYNIESFKAKAESLGYSVYTILVTNPNSKSNEDKRLVQDIRKYPYDKEIMNDGDLDKLEKLAIDFVEEIIYGRED